MTKKALLNLINSKVEKLNDLDNAILKGNNDHLIKYRNKLEIMIDELSSITATL